MFLLGDDRVFDFAELEAHESSTRLQDSVGFFENAINVCDVTDSKGDCIGIH